MIELSSVTRYFFLLLLYMLCTLGILQKLSRNSPRKYWKIDVENIKEVSIIIDCNELRHSVKKKSRKNILSEIRVDVEFNLVDELLETHILILFCFKHRAGVDY